MGWRRVRAVHDLSRAATDRSVREQRWAWSRRQEMMHHLRKRSPKVTWALWRHLPARQRISEHLTIASTARGSTRVTRASAQKEIDEPAGEFVLGAADPLDLGAQPRRHDQIFAALSRKSAMFVRAGDGRSAGPIQASGLSPRDCSH
jgi:hypothetical protein